MFHKALQLQFKQGTKLQVKFQTGEIKEYDMSKLFKKYPQLEALKNRKLFLSGKLMGAYGIIWNEDLDIEVETIYEEGKTIKVEEISSSMVVGNAVVEARNKAGLSQKELSNLTGIDQSDISKIERGVGNPSINTIDRIAKALNNKLVISITNK